MHLHSPRGEWERPSSFRRASITDEPDSVEIDWAMDSAFRFFPVESDPLLGWRLHRFDIATNKALTLAARTETRDYVDILDLIREFPLPAIVWAACGKDPGFSPASLLRMMRRFARIDPAELAEIQARDLDPIGLKERWHEASDRAQAEILRIADEQPDLPTGVAFIDRDGRPGWIGDEPDLRIHFPTLGGCWPTVRAVPG